MKQNKHLDEHIKQALENLEVHYDPDSWEVLEQRMDDALPAASDALDSLVAGSLAGLEVPVQPESWDLMQQRIEAEEAAEMIENEAQIDNLAYDKLHRISVPYQSSHWSLMARRLEEEYSLRQKLYRYKAAEVGLMVLLFLAIIRFLPYADSLLNPRPSAPQMEQFQIAPPAPGHLPAATTPEHATTPSQPVAQAETGADNLTAASSGADAITHEGGTTLATSKAGTNDRRGVQFQSLDMPFPKVASLAVSQAPLANTTSRHTRHRKAELPVLLTALDPAGVEPRTVNALILTKASPILEKSKLRFSVFSTIDYNYVFTPSNRISILDTLIATDSDTTAASGYGGGILVNFKKGRWEVQTGGIYSFKRYVPNTPVFLFETVKYYVEENFHGIQQDIFQVPLNLQYYFKDRGNWRIYGLGGASAHFITSSVYEIKYRRTPTFNFGIPSAPGDEDKSIRQEKEFPKGILDGGNLEDNLYFTANVGLGVERFVTPRWSLFFQPNYQHYLMKRGIGTNHDKIYTFSFYLGTKIGLK
ncbi:MAG: hypothetical protein ACE5FF_02130 [Saprospiraceae bacterium]